MGLLGEEHFGDDLVWLTKTHFPLKKSSSSRFQADKIVCLVRNPIDVIPSAASLAFLYSHSLEPHKPWSEFRYWPHVLNWFMRTWNTYHEQMSNLSQETPTLFLTYE